MNETALPKSAAPLEPQEAQGQPKPWTPVTLNSGGIWQAFKGSRTPAEKMVGKYVAVEDPNTKNIVVFNENGSFTLSPDQQSVLGHITMEEITAFVEKAKAAKAK